METVFVINSESSLDSIEEIEPPKKLPPPVIDIDEDDILLNVHPSQQQRLSSPDSIEEIEPPKKLPPLVIDIDVEDITLNVHSVEPQRVLAQTIYSRNEVIVETDSPSHWTKDMIKFYNDDWGDEDMFTVKELQEKMDKNPTLWAVSRRDMSSSNRKSKSSLKCWNCCQHGHTSYQCKEPLRIQKCHMCGEPGHKDVACPNSVCLNCGNQMKSFVLCCSKCESESNKQCSRCCLLGHHFLNCSDNWRRFHSTVDKSVIDISNQGTYKSMHEIWCCNCGKKGHHQIHCHIRKDLLSFPDTFPFVASYETSFNEAAISKTEEGRLHNNICNSTKTKNKKGSSHNINNKDNQLKFIMNLNKISKHKKAKKRRRNRKGKARILLNGKFFHQAFCK